MQEQQILKQEEKILNEIKKEEKLLLGLEKKLALTFLFIALMVGGLIVGLIYLKQTSARIYIEKTTISAPSVNLSSLTAGTLEEIFVNEGDVVTANTIVARVGNELVKAKVDGLIISINKNIGKLFNRGEAVITMIDPNELRAIGRVEEDKGLKDISIGQNVMFNVDAFSGKKYFGIVDEISPTSRDSGVVFNISDKREMKEYEIKVRFDLDAYPELKNGMSAKMWIYKK